MRHLQHAREAGRELRKELGLDSESLFSQLCEYIWDEHDREVISASPAKLDGGRAEVKPDYVFYNETFEGDTDELIHIVVHEAGHLERHRRLHRQGEASDPVMAGTYVAREKVPAVARYSKKSREEAEASAFAAEFVCPSDVAFKRWRENPEATIASIARELGASEDVARAQLVEALYQRVAGNADAFEEKEERNELELDEHQAPAAAHTGSAALIDAGPGTGKTATLVERAAARVWASAEEGDRTPVDAAHQVLVLTFSNEAQRELELRLERRLGKKVAGAMTVTTFHGLGRQILHLHGDAVHLSQDAPLLDEVAQEELILQAFGQAECESIVSLHNPPETADKAARHISHLKQRLTREEGELKPWTPELLRRKLDELRHGAVEASSDSQDLEEMDAFHCLFEEYENAKEELGAVDFADLIALSIRVLRRRDDVAEAYRDRYPHVLVDEFQDVSRAVSIFLELLCGPENPPWVVGDARQAIYRFLNAAPENVTDFQASFSDAEVFRLQNNYRSSPKVVETANRLAMLMENPEMGKTGAGKDGPQTHARWQAAGDLSPEEGTGPAVKVAVANSDEAEYQGIACQVERWIENGTDPHDIAVLARRNKDVRDTVVALGAAGILASSSGMVTPEGAAGDLAAVITIADAPEASVPRLARALGQDCYNDEEVNQATEQLLEALTPEGTFAFVEEPKGLAAEVAEVCERMQKEQFGADAFSMMTTFLFDASPYLRQLLDQLDVGSHASNPQQGARAQETATQVAASLRMTEGVTALSQAAGYRFSHAGEDPVEARLRFAEFFRRKLRDATPTAVAPKRTEGAVQVMTCHAAKGLEFPRVIAAGQTLSGASSSYAWLPDDLQPAEGRDTEQAESLLFVAATRAEQSLVVSYAETASGRPRARERDLPPLLERWIDVYGPPVERWPDREAEKPEASFGAVWGASAKQTTVSARALSQRHCDIRTYVEDVRGITFPAAAQPLYPRFFSAVRQTLRALVKVAHERGEKTSKEEARGVLSEKWEELEAREHDHHEMYHRVALRYVDAFARAFAPMASGHRPLEGTKPMQMGTPEVGVRLGFVASFYDDDGQPTAILFRPESCQNKLSSDGSAILWSELRSKRIPFVLLRELYLNLRPYVFSGEDGRLYPFQWSTQEGSMQKALLKAGGQLAELSDGRYAQKINSWKCDRCPSRLNCPFWLRAGM